jgi:LmbE family N-acetylglucosaminyl deacetylase
MKIQKNSRSIFLAPHPDDAALSCGGSITLMAQRAERPIVVTLFSGDRSTAAPLSDFARSLHTRWQLSDSVPAERRIEDQHALDRLHAALISLPFADAIYRLDPATQQHLYNSEAAIFGPICETTIVAEVADALQAVIESIGSADIQLIAPLAAGQHVDHVIARAAAERLAWPLIYYEDFPYAEDAVKLDRVWGADDWAFETIELDTEALQAKAESIAQHRSQLSTFFKNEAEIEQRLRAYAQEVGGGKFVERYWRKVRRT